jgi:hypothetical protein
MREELEIIQRKRADKAMKRYPISPEGPRASEVVSTSSNTIMFSCNKTFLAGFLTLRCRSSMFEERSHRKSTRRGHHSRRGTQSVPEERMPSPKSSDNIEFLYNPKSQVDPTGKTAANFRGSHKPGSHRHRDRGDLQI